MNLMNMFTRMLTQRAMKWGIDKGTRQMSRIGQKKTPPVALTKSQTTQQAKSSREMAKRARQAAKLTRRIGR